MRRYPEYRDSGVEWLGEVPAHWGTALIKHVAAVESGHTPSRRHPEYWLQEECTVPWFTLADVWQLRDDRRIYVRDTKEKVSERGLANSSARHLPAGTVLLSRTASVGFSGIMEVEMATSQDFVCWICGPKLRPKYLLYMLRAMRPDFRRLIMGSTHQTIYMPDARAFRTLLPPLEEQETISACLDEKTGQIDALIQKKQRLIELLKEQRTALINRAVTKGLDPNVPTKNSGIEWLGEVPEHWKKGRLRDVSHRIETGPFGSQLHADEYVDDGIPVVNPSNIIGGRIEPDRTKSVTAEVATRLRRHRLRAGNIVFARRGEMGRCAIVRETEEGWLCGTGSIKIIVNEAVALPAYISELLSGEGVRQWLELESVGSTMSNLNADILSRIPLLVPSSEEQHSILEFIWSHIKKNSSVIAREVSLIAALDELRSSLISEVVTGKIDVRDWDRKAKATLEAVEAPL